MGGCVFWLSLPGLNRQPNEPFFDSSFFGNSAIIRVFTALDWISRRSGANIMAQKLKIGKQLNSTKGNRGYF